jgi:hypothetical protein
MASVLVQRRILRTRRRSSLAAFQPMVEGGAQAADQLMSITVEDTRKMRR